MVLKHSATGMVNCHFHAVKKSTEFNANLAKTTRHSQMSTRKDVMKLERGSYANARPSLEHQESS